MHRNEVAFNNCMFSKKADTETSGTLNTSRIYRNSIYCLHYFSNQFGIISDKNINIGRICMPSISNLANTL